MPFLLDALKLFIQICLNIFFRDIKVRGFHQIPKEGPLLFAIAPHSNQFVDPLILTITCGRNVGFLAAKKSMDKFWIGMFARFLNSISVERPQDLAKVGTGLVYLDKTNPLILRGINSNFIVLTNSQFYNIYSKNYNSPSQRSW
jgi:glycerol-3-phosphate O-acyltransferase/dihydroxyacetone phosphate acyltransferase